MYINLFNLKFCHFLNDERKCLKHRLHKHVKNTESSTRVVWIKVVSASEMCIELHTFYFLAWSSYSERAFSKKPDNLSSNVSSQVPLGKP